MEGLVEPRLLQLVRPHRGEVTCLDAASACLVTGGSDRALRLWRWTSSTAGGAGWSECSVAAAAHRHGVTVVRWAAAGLLLASGGVDGAARLWGRELAPRRQLLAPTATAVRALCWAGGCARLLVGHDDGALCVWSASAGKLLARLRPHEDSLRAVATPAREALLLTACTDGVLKVFDLAEVCACGADGDTGPAPLLWVDGAHDQGVVCADASEAGVAATGGQDGRVQLWCTVGEGETCQRSLQAWGAPLEGHTAAVTAVRWATGSLGGEMIASASLDRTARLWLAGGGCLFVLHAHTRYLTCVALAPDLRFMVTGSNDRTVRTWSLGAFSLEEELQPVCEVVAHFGIGDLEGIGPVDDTVGDEGDSQVEAEPGVLRLAYSVEQAHSGACNCIAAYGDLIATASSDGLVKIYQWDETREQPVLQHELEAHQYPALAAEFGSDGRVLLSAGLDGCAFLWDVQSGVQLRALSAASVESRGEVGGGGARGARVSPHRPPLLLLATDDGLALLWSVASADPEPLHVYTGHSEAVTCCAWSPDGFLLATGAASGELRLHTPPPEGRTLHHEPVAHDLGVQSCDFAPHPEALGAGVGEYVLATAGCDSLVKLWLADKGGARLMRQFSAHGGGVTCVRWGAVSLLASAGADGWARVWRVAASGATVRSLAEASAPGALAATLLTPTAAKADALLVVGTVGGGMTVWRLPETKGAGGDQENEVDEADECSAVRLWGFRGIERWLREYVTPIFDSEVRSTLLMKLTDRTRKSCLSGAQLLDAPLPLLLDRLGYGTENEEQQHHAEICDRLRSELEWLRRPQPSLVAERRAPHSLLCPLTHRLLYEPVAAADGFTYERAAILEWFLADGSALSPMSKRRLSTRRVQPNLGTRHLLREYLRQS